MRLSRVLSIMRADAVGRDMAMGRTYVSSGQYMEDSTEIGRLVLRIAAMTASLTAEESAELDRREQGETLA